MALAGSRAIPLQVKALSLDDLFAADEVFVVNSVIGVWPVIALERKAWAAGPLALQMQRWIADAQDV
jgi:4-amino-4-deoxychorismate lyase